MERPQLYFEISLENQLGASGGDYFRCPAPGCKQAIWLSKCVRYVMSRRPCHAVCDGVGLVCTLVWSRQALHGMAPIPAPLFECFGWMVGAVLGRDAASTAIRVAACSARRAQCRSITKAHAIKCGATGPAAAFERNVSKFRALPAGPADHRALVPVAAQGETSRAPARPPGGDYNWLRLRR
jgi:hypothetical protein